MGVAALSGMSTLTMYADNIEQVKKLTPAILDLAVAENGLETSQANVESTAQKVGCVKWKCYYVKKNDWCHWWWNKNFK